MVGVVKQEPLYDVKSHLATEICHIYQNSLFIFPCIHYKSTNYITTPSPFIDWYMILRVGEDAGIDTIRKQYHKLALLLHPDKNKHPKAEFAFKLISQAYKCLSDDTRRSSFNLERWRNHCNECSRIPQNTHSFSFPSHPTPAYNAKTKRNSPNSYKHSTSNKILQHFKLIREQLKEEVRVIESCISINQYQNRKNGYPVFNPTNYMHLGYPHRRNHHHDMYCKKGAIFEGGHSGNVHGSEL